MATIGKSSMATLPRMRSNSNQLHYNTPSHGTPQLRPDTCKYITISPYYLICLIYTIKRKLNPS